MVASPHPPSPLRARHPPHFSGEGNSILNCRGSAPAPHPSPLLPLRRRCREGADEGAPPLHPYEANPRVDPARRVDQPFDPQKRRSLFGHSGAWGLEPPQFFTLSPHRRWGGGEPLKGETGGWTWRDRIVLQTCITTRPIEYVPAAPAPPDTPPAHVLSHPAQSAEPAHFAEALHQHPPPARSKNYTAAPTVGRDSFLS